MATEVFGTDKKEIICCRSLTFLAPCALMALSIAIRSLLYFRTVGYQNTVKITPFAQKMKMSKGNVGDDIMRHALCILTFRKSIRACIV